MRPKRPAFLVSALLTVLLLLSACGGNFNSHPSATVTLTYWYSGDQAQGPVLADIISKFETFYPNVKVVSQYMAPDQEHDAFVNAAKSGTAPDVMTSNAFWTREFGDAKYLYDLTSLAGPLGDFDKVRATSVLDSSSLYGLPQTADLLVLYYNAAALSAKDITAPTTMADFDAANKALTGSGKYGWEFSGDAFTAQVFMYAFGGGLANYQKTSLAESADTPESATGLDFLKQELQYAPPVDFTNGAANTLSDFKSGKVAMIIGNSDSYTDLLTGSAFTDPTNLGVALIPQDQTTGPVARSPVTGEDVVVSAKSKNIASSFSFATYLSSEINQVTFYKKLGLLPTRSSTQNDSALAKTAVFKSFTTAQIQTEFAPAYSKLGDAFYAPSSGIDTELQKFLTGKEDATAACTAIGAKLTTLIGQTQ